MSRRCFAPIGRDGRDEREVGMNGIASARGAALLGLSLLVFAGTDPHAADALSVADSGVGEAVVDRELQGRAERFQEGGEVWFWTRVVGGAEGDAIRHVWIRDEEELATVELSIDGSPWRTFSRKELHPGSAGSWVVEARDDTGRVLARAGFECTPAGAPEREGG